MTDIKLGDIEMWTMNGNKIIDQCESAHGEGYCARTLVANAVPTAFTVSLTIIATLNAYASPTKPAWGIQE